MGKIICFLKFLKKMTPGIVLVIFLVYSTRNGKSFDTILSIIGLVCWFLYIMTDDVQKVNQDKNQEIKTLRDEDKAWKKFFETITKFVPKHEKITEIVPHVSGEATLVLSRGVDFLEEVIQFFKKIYKNKISPYIVKHPRSMVFATSCIWFIFEWITGGKNFWLALVTVLASLIFLFKQEDNVLRGIGNSFMYVSKKIFAIISGKHGWQASCFVISIISVLIVAFWRQIGLAFEQVFWIMLFGIFSFIFRVLVAIHKKINQTIKK